MQMFAEAFGGMNGGGGGPFSQFSFGGNSGGPEVRIIVVCKAEITLNRAKIALNRAK